MDGVIMHGVEFLDYGGGFNPIYVLSDEMTAMTIGYFTDADSAVDGIEAAIEAGFNREYLYGSIYPTNEVFGDPNA